jgi:tRNA threonylcarbamoyladenosine biosynthesis protein TsaE
MDLYRLKSLDEIINIGFYDCINNGGITVIEWPEKVKDLLPEKSIKVYLAHNNSKENSRLIRAELK